MDDLIFRSDALKALSHGEGCGNICSRAIKSIPAVYTVPVLHGRWIYPDPRKWATISGICSCCGWEAHYFEDDVAGMPYCPNCGAKLKESNNDQLA